MPRYYLIQGPSLPDLEKQVNEKLAVGYEPHGSPCSFVIKNKDGYGNEFREVWFCQAIIYPTIS